MGSLTLGPPETQDPQSLADMGPSPHFHFLLKRHFSECL